MTTFYLIRHGEKDAEERLIVGRAGAIHLTARGRRQAAAIAECLGSRPIRHVFSSPLERARETAEPLAQRRNVPVHTLAGLHEYEFGEWSGQTLDQLAAAAGWNEFNAFRSGTRPPGGEMMTEVQARVAGEMIRLAAEHPSDEIALVSHGDPIRAVICHFLGIPLDLFHRIEIGVGSISVLQLGAQGAQLTGMNFIPACDADE